MSFASAPASNDVSANVTPLRRISLFTVHRVVAVTLACTATIVLGANMLGYVPSNGHQAVADHALAPVALSADAFHADGMPVPPVEAGYLPGRYVLHADTIDEQPPTF